MTPISDAITNCVVVPKIVTVRAYASAVPAPRVAVGNTSAISDDTVAGALTTPVTMIVGPVRTGCARG